MGQSVEINLYRIFRVIFRLRMLRISSCLEFGGGYKQLM